MKEKMNQEHPCQGGSWFFCLGSIQLLLANVDDRPDKKNAHSICQEIAPQKSLSEHESSR